MNRNEWGVNPSASTAADPTPYEIGCAFDTLGIDPEWVLGIKERGGQWGRAAEFSDAVWDALDDAVRELAAATSVPVTPDTPNGTAIMHPEVSQDGNVRRFIGDIDGRLFAYSFCGSLVSGCYDGWSVVPTETTEEIQGSDIPPEVAEAIAAFRRAGDAQPTEPEPPPVEVGQTRAMPMRVVRIVPSQRAVWLDGEKHARSIDTVASWPLWEDA